MPRNSGLGLYLAVLPAYRTPCMQVLRSMLKDELSVYVSDAHLDATVRTDKAVTWYDKVRIHRLIGNRAFIQTGSWGDAASLASLIVDLNPRSITAWVLLVLRRLTHRRTLVWGHLYPQSGKAGKTSVLRRLMRRLSDGIVLYTYSDLERATQEMPDRKAWVAPNSLYEERFIRPSDVNAHRGDVLYVGRLVAQKKPELLMRGFAIAASTGQELRLVIVGDGPELSGLRSLATKLNIDQRVVFKGWVSDPQELASIYSTSICSVSPGFVGLSVTQSAGFGVPMLVARDEPHSPEVELAEVGAIRWFESDSPHSLANAIAGASEDCEHVPDRQLSEWVAKHYSAEAMADGLLAALNASPASHIRTGGPWTAI